MTINSGGTGLASGGTGLASGGTGQASGGTGQASGGTGFGDAPDAVSAYASGALVSNRDGVVGAADTPRSHPAPLKFDDPSNIDAWDPLYRQQLMMVELLARLAVAPDPAQANDGLMHLYARSLGGAYWQSVVSLWCPPTADLVERQLGLVTAYADLRVDRTAEILAQRDAALLFITGVAGARPERHRRTFELLGACVSVCQLLTQRLKHAFACRRPAELSAQVQPMIETPGHGSFPSGHAAEAFCCAQVLEFVVRRAGKRQAALETLRSQLTRTASRVAVNRVVAGVHFPADNAAGQVVGTMVAQAACAYATRHAAGDRTSLGQWSVDGRLYKDLDYPARPLSSLLDADSKASELPVPSGDSPVYRSDAPVNVLPADTSPILLEAMNAACSEWPEHNQ